MQRTEVRHSVPQGQDREQVKQIVDALCSHHQLRAAAIVLLARATGMRLREAILEDLSRLSHSTPFGRRTTPLPPYIELDRTERARQAVGN